MKPNTPRDATRSFFGISYASAVPRLTATALHRGHGPLWPRGRPMCARRSTGLSPPVGDPLIGVVLTAVYVPAWLHSASLVECREHTEGALERLEPSINLSAPLEMQLQLALGLTLTLTMGLVENARMALASALEIAESLDDVDAQLRNLWAQWVLHFNIGECRDDTIHCGTVLPRCRSHRRPDRRACCGSTNGLHAATRRRTARGPALL